MAATPWGCLRTWSCSQGRRAECVRPEKLLFDGQSSEEAVGGHVLSEWQARFLPCNRKLLRPVSARRELSRCLFARSFHAESGKTKTARSFILRPKQEKGASAKSVAPSTELLHGELVQKSQLHFETVAYFSHHTLAAASWGVGTGAAGILSSESTLMP